MPPRVAVLLIDDQPFIGELVRRLIGSEETVELYTCHEPHRATTIAKQLSPDVIMLDLMMPDVDGLTILAELRQDPRTAAARIIILSGADDPVARKRSADAGANGFLVKLPPQDVLLAAIRGVDTSAPRPRDTEQVLDATVIARLREATSADPGFVDTMLDQFVTEAGAVLDTMRSAVRSLDADSLRRTAHRLRGTAQTVGANRLAALSAQMEGHAGGRPRAAVLKVLFTEIERAFEEVNEALASDRAGAHKQ